MYFDDRCSHGRDILVSLGVNLQQLQPLSYVLQRIYNDVFLILLVLSHLVMSMDVKKR
jgi:hypothetical protein